MMCRPSTQPLTQKWTLHSRRDRILSPLARGSFWCLWLSSTKVLDKLMSRRRGAASRKVWTTWLFAPWKSAGNSWSNYYCHGNQSSKDASINQGRCKARLKLILYRECSKGVNSRAKVRRKVFSKSDLIVYHSLLWIIDTHDKWSMPS